MAITTDSRPGAIQLPGAASLRKALKDRGWARILDETAYVVGFSAILPGLVPGIIYPHWWLATFIFYETGLPPLFGLHPTALIAATAAAVYLALRVGAKYLLLVAALLLASLLSSVSAAALAGLLLAAYVLASFVSLCLLAWDKRLSAPALVGFVALFAIVLWMGNHGPVIVAGKIVEFVINYFLIRLSLKLLRDNYGQLRAIESKYYYEIVVETVRLWLPVIVFAVAGIVLNSFMMSYARQQAYQSGLVELRPSESEAPATPNLYWDIKYTIDARFTDIEAAATEFRQRAEEGAAQLPEVMPGAAVAEFEKVMPAPPLIRGDPCPSGGVKGALLGPPCRMIVRAVNSSYEEYRAAKREQLRAEVLEISLRQEREAKDRIASAHALVVKRLAEAKAHSKGLFLYGFNGYLGIGFVLNVIFFFVLVKSFLLVLARVAYSEDYRASFSVVPEARASRRSAGLALANKPSNTLALRKGRKEPFFLVNNHHWDNTAGDVMLPPPQPFACYFARIANKAYILNRLDLTTVRQSPRLRVKDPAKIVALQLRRGQKVVFRFSDFAGMTSQVRIETTLSPNISLFCLGRRFFYVSATGPGTLLLMAQGEIKAGQQLKGVAVAADRLLAFDVTERFKLDSRRNYANIYLNSAYVTPQGALAVSDTRDIPQAGMFGKVWQLVKFLILPW